MILYFSGTGNTRHCAEELGRMLGEDVRRITVDQLRQPAQATINVGDERVIFMFPVYAWSLPPVVSRLLEQARFVFDKAPEAWMVATCGDDVGLTDKVWRRLVSDAGFRPMGAFSVEMPNTYVCMKGFDVDSAELKHKKVKASTERLRHIANAIKAGKPVEPDVVRGKAPWFKTVVINPWFRHFAMSAKGFHVNDKCTGCGLCIRRCPMENLVPGRAGRPVWGPHCAFCLRCYHGCPSGAVQYGEATEGKDRYTRFLKANNRD